MRARQMIPWTLTLALTVAMAACGDDGEEAMPDEDAQPSVTVDEVRGTDADTAAPAEAGAEEEPAETEEVSARTATLYAVQVGAFTRSENADRLRQQLESEGLPAWSPTAEVGGQSFQQVRVGATETVAEARRLAERVREEIDGEAWIAPVPPEVQLPDPVIGETRTLLENG